MAINETSRLLPKQAVPRVVGERGISTAVAGQEEWAEDNDDARECLVFQRPDRGHH
jgi:hypothetical protein